MSCMRPILSAVLAIRVLTAFTVVSAGIAQSSMVLEVLGLAGIVAAVGLFVKCKPWENAGE